MTGGSGQKPLDELTALLARLPGIGERSAQRHAFHILEKDVDFALALGESIAQIHARICHCRDCGNFCENQGEGSLCTICSDTRRNRELMCVVARVQDLLAIERSGTYRGVYFVLHGLLSPLDGRGPDTLPLESLQQRVLKLEVKEVVLATPLSVDGEATALYVAQALKDIDCRISRIASGVPHGGELEFTDQITLGRAFESRRVMHR